jgi:ribonuclease HIII
MAKRITRVYVLPKDQEARSQFLEALRAVEKQFGVEMQSGSAHDEIDYADLLAKELEQYVGDRGVENIRQNFERANRA